MEYRQDYPVQQVAEIELVYRNKVKAAERPSVKNAEEAYKLLIKNWNMDTIELLEAFKVIYLNRGRKVIAIYHHSTGGTAATYVDNKLILSGALKCAAASIIIAHNHPSGILKPSDHDRLATLKLKAAAELFDIDLSDHLIVTRDGYFSFMDEGLL